ncbi:hypothetical protein SA496_15660 [Pseudomonas sp. JS3066]|uniref:hypothetical protein n=1 Tax=Pseudomonas sp. JS3066 TaxID=3090665 RepID=UPI002E7AEF3D|nr:hypothetical protein [Pseudomonas sp. JS3066]WVK91165.1 hypothetical protein SA496_15660 [Pseudomonas sp. JS3066]
MRELTGHQVNPANDTLRIQVVDEPGSGGANHAYVIHGANMHSNPSFGVLEELAGSLGEEEDGYFVLFQQGPIPDAGVNGVTHEVLLAIVIDRLECFQRGPFASAYNEVALTHLLLAQKTLLDRTRERIQRGVEGTHKA